MQEAPASNKKIRFVDTPRGIGGTFEEVFLQQVSISLNKKGD